MMKMRSNVKRHTFFFIKRYSVATIAQMETTKVIQIILVYAKVKNFSSVDILAQSNQNLRFSIFCVLIESNLQESCMHFPN